jgi:uncharacterized protein (DUF58 family)
VVSSQALTPERILRRMEWRVIRRLDGRLQGDYRTLFRGNGIDVAGLREYQPGDDLRHVDWNVTARTDVTHVREFLEDREITAWLVLDRSPSMGFGPIDRHKHLVLTELTAVVAQLLARGGNRVGAVLFDSAVQQTVPPGHGRTQVLRILSLLAAPPVQEPVPPRSGRFRRQPDRKPDREPDRKPDREPGAQRTRLAVPLRSMLGIARRRCVVVIISDFISEPGWDQPLAQLTQRHDVVAFQVSDRREGHLPAVGAIWVEDAETGEQIFVDTDDPQFQARLGAEAGRRQAALVDTVRAAGTELYRISTDEDLVRALARISDLRRRSGR